MVSVYFALIHLIPEEAINSAKRKRISWLTRNRKKRFGV